MAQWKRAGLITQRSLDRHQVVLWIENFFWFLFFDISVGFLSRIESRSLFGFLYCHFNCFCKNRFYFLRHCIYFLIYLWLIRSCSIAVLSLLFVLLELPVDSRTEASRGKKGLLITTFTTLSWNIGEYSQGFAFPKPVVLKAWKLEPPKAGSSL